MSVMRVSKLICMFVVVLIVLVAGCGSGGQEGAAGPSPDGSGGADNLEIGPLVVQTARTGNFKAVYVPSPYGCSFHSVDDTRPRWSSDGRLIAFESGASSVTLGADGQVLQVR